jgi:hypothetical protein
MGPAHVNVGHVTADLFHGVIANGLWDAAHQGIIVRVLVWGAA